ncbi:DUF4394 domain-containing protein [Sphingomonas sp. 1P06PA]|uniref:DUF4394 domain-containing protein n=1 Tax=Sphingomonas sp. 1P06PA TaxID=554121 RepID=UPI0039A5E134
MRKLLLTAVAALALAGPATAATIYGVDEQNRLISFDSSAPGATLSQVQLSGGNATNLLALDFRPLTGQLYGLGDDNVIYTVNRATGQLTAASGTLALTGSNFAFDFNPSIDRLRIVSNLDNNYVFNPNDGSLTNAVAVAYGASDPNFGRNAVITAAAYTPSALTNNPATSSLFVIDANLDILARQANSAGTLTTVGALGVNFGARDSFDIDGAGIGYAQDGANFYTVNLATGALSLAGTTDRVLYGISAATAVPEPAAWALMIGGFGLVGGTMRRRTRRETLATA